jgi:hypothetical protein
MSHKPKPFTPRLLEDRVNLAHLGPLYMLHRPYRARSGKLFNIPAIKTELERLRGNWIAKVRYSNYLEVIEGMEKLIYKLHHAKTLTDLYHISVSHLWHVFQVDMQKLRKEIETYFKPEHPEYLFAMKLFNVEQRIEDEVHSTSEIRTLRDREKDCRGLKEKGLCEHTRDCVWKAPSRWAPFTAPCQFRPVERDQPLAYAPLRHEP